MIIEFYSKSVFKQIVTNCPMLEQLNNFIYSNFSYFVEITFDVVFDFDVVNFDNFDVVKVFR